MKKQVIAIAATSLFVAAVMLSSCNNVNQKESADRKVEREKEDLQDARKEASLEAQSLTSEDLNKFKDEAEVLIKKNETRIVELRNKMKESGNALDEKRQKRIAELEEQNWELRTRINSFDIKSGNWQEFKREFDHDMEQIGKSLEDLTVDNKD